MRAHFEDYRAPPTAARGCRRLLAHYDHLLIPAESSVLEVGCGDGELLASIRAKQKSGFDLSAKQFARAQALS